MNIWPKNTCLLVTAVVLTSFACYAEDDSLYFDVSDTGAGIRDVIMATNTTVCIYRNEHGKRVAGSVPLGTGPNVPLY